MQFTIRLPPVLPSLGSAHALYEAMGQRFWDLFCFLVFAFCLWVNANMLFPQGDTQVGSEQIPPASCSRCVGKSGPSPASLIYTSILMN